MVSQLGPREVARIADARVRGSDGPNEEAGDPTRPGITYVGFTGRANLGDEAIMAAVAQLLPAFDIRREHPDPVALMVGGGTIINSKKYYLTRVLREERPGLPIFTFAPGVRDPAFWGVTEPMDEWMAVFRSAESVTVRGPDSARHLQTLGWPGEVHVIGDPALSLIPREVEKAASEVIVAPLNTDGNLFGGRDAQVLSALATECERLADLGMTVTLMSSFPEDDRWILEMERMIDRPVNYFCGYASLDATLVRIAGASLVVGERLHASILAAAMRTPFVAVAYRPKTLDFVRSINAEHLAVTTDELGSLSTLVDTVLADTSVVVARIDDGVTPLAEAQQAHADDIAESLGFPQ
jgi:polysaccharide pyruvyl transferase WcaK-like protein